MGNLLKDQQNPEMGLMTQQFSLSKHKTIRLNP